MSAHRGGAHRGPAGGGASASGTSGALPEGRPDVFTTARVTDSVASTFQGDGSLATILEYDDDGYNLGFVVFAAKRAADDFPWLIITSDQGIYFSDGSVDPYLNGVALNAETVGAIGAAVTSINTDNAWVETHGGSNAQVVLRADSGNGRQLRIEMDDPADPGGAPNIRVGSDAGHTFVQMATDPDGSNPKLSFFDTLDPVPQPAAPTTLGDVIAALKALGLVAT